MKNVPSLYNPMSEILEVFDQPQILTEKVYFQLQSIFAKGGVVIESIYDLITCIHILEEQGLVKVGRHMFVFIKIYRVKDGK